MRIGLATVALLAACASGTAGTSSTTVQSGSGWQEPAQYEYTVDSRCGERLLIGRLTITVADGKVTQAVALDDSARHVASDPQLVANLPTLRELLDEYEAAKRDGADVAKAEFDPADGHPTRIDLDPKRNAIDDEACYEISGFQLRT